MLRGPVGKIIIKWRELEWSPQKRYRHQRSAKSMNKHNYYCAYYKNLSKGTCRNVSICTDTII